MKCVFLPLVGLMSLLSCKKSDNPGPPAQAEEFQQFAVTKAKFEMGTKFLKREVYYFSTKPYLKNVRMFSYDGSNRCTEIKIGTIDSSLANPSFTLSQTLTFHYSNPTALLPSSLSSVRTVFPNLITEFYYKFNGNGLKITDSVRVKNMAGEPADRTIHYVYDKDRVYATPVLTGFSMDNVSFDTLDILKAGNIERQTSRSENSTGISKVTYAYTYDQNVSPYNKLNIANSLYFESSVLGLGYNVPLETHYMGVTTNNMTSWVTGSSKAIFNYLYDQDKYPLQKEMFLLGDTSPRQVTFFEY
jgi:hypothetical protein